MGKEIRRLKIDAFIAVGLDGQWCIRMNICADHGVQGASAHIEKHIAQFPSGHLGIEKTADRVDREYY